MIMRRVNKWVRPLLWVLALIICMIVTTLLFYLRHIRATNRILELERSQMQALQGENTPIAGDYDHNLAVNCDNGIFVGREMNGVRAYKGIPYAEPPVGNLRWRPPVDARRGNEVREALYFGKSCIQTEADTERASLYPQGEDCLTLNVWAPVTDTPGKAVMVFFPGGGFGWGGTADPIYDGQKLIEAHDDIILVTANYRVGLMGFIDFSEVPGGEEYEKSGNLGLLDQISALRWVRRNISRFGGDPDNVTIFGESAGASSVSFLPLIDESKGLFRRLIAQSGSLAFSYSRDECKTLTRMLMEKTKAASMEDLLSLSEQEIIKINQKLNDWINFPERDGIVLPEDLYSAYAGGAGSEIEMLTGTNADEARYFIGELGGYEVYTLAGPLVYASIVDRVDKGEQRFAEAFLALQQEDLIWRVTEFLNDLIFRGPAIEQAELHANNGGRNYMYYWTMPSAIEHYGACHAVELAYVFNNLDDTIFTGEPADPKLAAAVQNMWINFAKTGDPSAGGITWEPYEARNRRTMILGSDIHMESDPLPEQRVLIKPLLKYRFNAQYRAADYALLYLKKQIIKINLGILGAALLIFTVVKVRKFIRKKRR